MLNVLKVYMLYNIKKGVNMSDLFGKLKQGIDKSTKVIGAKSASLIDSNKVKSEISTLKKTKDELIQKIGLTVYETERESFTIDMVDDELASIHAIDVQIKEKELELERIKLEAEEKIQELNK